MIVSLAYDPDNKRILALCRTDPPYQADIRFFIKDGEEAFGISFEKLSGLISIQVDNDGMAVNMEERPACIPAKTDELPVWLRFASSAAAE